MQQVQETIKIEVEIVNSFISDGTGGNPAGVVLDADGLSEAQMQSVAARLGLSEVAFVSLAQAGSFRLDFFTPNLRIPHCGHATVAAFSRLAALGRASEGWTSKQTVDGPRRILIRDGAAYIEQTAPRYRRPVDWANDVGVDDVLRSLGLVDADLDPGTAPIVVNTGNSFLLLGVRDEGTLRAIVPDQDAITAISETLDLVGYYVFITDAAATRHDAATRMFAPRFAIAEEAATGMAAGPLACLLHDCLGSPKRKYLIEQGKYMAEPSPSLISVDLDIVDGAIHSLMSGGNARLVETRTIEIKPAMVAEE